LGTLGGTSSVGHGINSKGDVVGFAHIQGNAARAFVYVYAENTMYRLGHLIPSGSGWTLEIAYGINDRGQIVGRGI
jgi:probable HAF family extracellular repeat protein